MLYSYQLLTLFSRLDVLFSGDFESQSPTFEADRRGMENIH